MSTLSYDELINIVHKSFESEKKADLNLIKQLVSDDFVRTSMTISGDTLFPDYYFNKELGKLEANNISREFHIWNIAANEKQQTVFVELTEIEKDGSSELIWPYMLICEIKSGKISRTRQYGDPAVMSKKVKLKEIKKIIRG